ncbi:MAG: M48 family metallopeptidase [Candidatus Omnitrophota bacterium]
MSFKDLTPAKKYSIIKYTLVLVDIGYTLLLLCSFAGLGLSKFLYNYTLKALPVNFLLLPVYLLTLFVIYGVLAFPLNFYRTFTLEHKFHLSTQNFMDWLQDQLKSGLISFVIGLILLALFYLVLGNFPHHWWWVLSAVWIFFSLILAKALPILIIPLFFKYKKLSDEALRQRILDLAFKLKVKILDVFEIDLSKKTLKANAAFVGLGNTRRVLLADTLKDKYTHDEIAVILAHEFAHYRLRHMLKLILVNSAVTFMIFYLIFRTGPYYLQLFGFSSLSDIAALPLVLIYFVVFGLIMQPFENYISRHFERDADRLAIKVTGLRDAFISMMEKLAAQNLADRRVHPVIKLFFFDHPPVDERIEMASKT